MPIITTTADAKATAAAIRSLQSGPLEVRALQDYIAVTSNRSAKEKTKMNTDYLNFCPRLKKMIDTGTSVNSKGEKIKTKAISISPLNNIKVIREILKELKPIRTLEIGLAHGASALTILSTLREVSPNGFLHTAIDPKQTTVWSGSSIRVINDEGRKFPLLRGLFCYCLSQPSKRKGEI